MLSLQSIDDLNIFSISYSFLIYSIVYSDSPIAFLENSNSKKLKKTQKLKKTLRSSTVKIPSVWKQVDPSISQHSDLCLISFAVL